MNSVIICLCILQLLGPPQLCLAVGSNVSVTTLLGDVIGKRVFVDGKNVIQFLKIPFAEPPINELRFKKPVPVSKWKAPLDATQYGPSCSQNQLTDNLRFIRDKNVNTSEDCLYLNIYVPAENVPSKNKLPVLVWIHGGAFKWGQGMRNDGSRLALGGDAIVVTVNYRLGVFGFLATDAAQLLGNYGLWDVHVSLKWIKSNIGSFGGNPGQVAVFGESAGGRIVSCLTISPVNKGLFNRAIIMSGPLYSPSTLSNSPKIRTFSKGFIESMNCTGKRAERANEFTMACLRKLDAKTVVDATDRLSKTDTFKLSAGSLGPVVDFDFIPDNVNKILTTTNSEAYKWFASLDLIIGDTDAEGSLIYYNLVNFQKKFDFNLTKGIPRRVLCNHIIPAVVRDFYNNVKKIAEEMCALYSTDRDSSDEQSLMAIAMYTDLMYWAPTLKSINAHISSDEPAYMYLFSHQVRYGLTPYRTEDRMPWIRGANHADDVYTLFGPQYVYPKNTEIDPADKYISSAMMKYWANFAKYGNPNGGPNMESSSSLTKWPKYDKEEKYLNINSTISVQKSIFPRRMKFWLERIPAIMKEVANRANSIGGLIQVYFSLVITCTILWIDNLL